ncbi:LysR family transcriptional regulator [Comamonas endophytica]|uniref:LysR family transcriptional regulator n=1 Tax=Comamonas endophytica TaxID=2949090 RepID=A0ABY6G9X3_9BURK|nr:MULTISPECIES: LysR family transcriptional regulator [unclassified Acidovorax]MCD2514238.1 LysR family transcriptional regulator [Acidovorax sp. D4N7]UYG51377.1 LysR family transcriptional regulator [Acidovorax sp. 5MLIR]
MSLQTIERAINARLKLRHYRLIVALERHRSITRVAEILGSSQPTVTRALADIEDIFHAVLFERTGRGLEPTAAGRVVIAHAAHAIAENDELLVELDGVRAGRQGRLRVGVLPYASTRVLDSTWSYLFSLRPKIATVSTEDVTGNLFAALRARTLDCAICRFSQGDPGDSIEQVLLYHQQPRLVVAKPSAALLTRYPEVDIARLSEMDWILPPPDTPIRGVIDAIFSAAGRRVPTPALEAYAVRTITSALRNLPRGITVLPDDIAQAVCAGGAAEVLEQVLPWSLPPVGLAWLRNSPKIELIDGLKQAVLGRMA